MKRIFRQIHLWLAVPFGIIVTLICFSGAMLVFEDEVTESCRHDLYFVERVGERALPVEQVLERVAATLPDSVSVTGVNISSNPERAWQVTLSKPRRASLYVDPYTGEVKGKSGRMPFFMTMFRLHRWLLDSMPTAEGGIFWGKMVVGTSTLMFVFVLVSGVVIWWPRTKKALKNSLKITAGKGLRRFWYDLHVAGGMYALVLLLAMALTGLTWSFSWYRAGFYKVFGVEMAQGGAPHGGGAPTGAKGQGEKGQKGRSDGDRPKVSPYAQWQKVYDVLKGQNPDCKQISLSRGTATVSFDRFGNQRAADRYAFNPRNGEITETTLYKDAAASGKMRGWIYSVHVGSWGGLITRILTFLAALLGASLPLTGYYLWIKRLLSKKKRGRSSMRSRA